MVAQVSLSFLLLIGAGLFLAQPGQSADSEPRLSFDNLLPSTSIHISTRHPDSRPCSSSGRFGSHDSLPGVESSQPRRSAGLSEQRMGQLGHHRRLLAQTRRATRAAHALPAAPGFFKTLGFPCCSAATSTNGMRRLAKVAIVNQKFAKRYFGDRARWASHRNGHRSRHQDGHHHRRRGRGYEIRGPAEPRFRSSCICRRRRATSRTG